jgi:hypothetical protein
MLTNGRNACSQTFISSLFEFPLRNNGRATYSASYAKQGCQMVYFQIKNTILGKFFEDLEIEDVIHFMANCSILLPLGNILWKFGTFYGHLEYFSRFGMLYQENSGNPDLKHFCGLSKDPNLLAKTFTPRRLLDSRGRLFKTRFLQRPT